MNEEEKTRKTQEKQSVRGNSDAETGKREKPFPAAPAEVVEYYEQSMQREIVETYVQSRPLPRRPSAVPPVKKQKHRFRGLRIFLLCVAVLAGVSATAHFWPEISGKKASGGNERSQTEEEKDSTAKVSIPTYKADKNVRFTVKENHNQSLNAQQIYKKVNPSVVTVLVQLKNSAAVGAGVIFTSDGYILTNYHVVAGGQDCSVTMNTNVTYSASYVAGDSGNDVAILKVNASGLPAAEIGSSDALTVGDKVYAIGNPLGVELRGTFTDGIVSAINRDVDVDGRNMTLVQTNAALNSGNSGGPLINTYGQVVGINTIKMSSSFSNIEGLGFALPTSSLKYIVSDLLTYGKVLPEPQLGISVEKLGTTLPDGTTGAKIVEVSAASAAGRAGLKKGDVLVSADGERVRSSDDVLRIRRRFHVGDKMKVTVWRSGKYLHFTLQLREAANG